MRFFFGTPDHSIVCPGSPVKQVDCPFYYHYRLRQSDVMKRQSDEANNILLNLFFLLNLSLTKPIIFYYWLRRPRQSSRKKVKLWQFFFIDLLPSRYEGTMKALLRRW
jgi:hypothetical protein